MTMYRRSLAALLGLLIALTSLATGGSAAFARTAPEPPDGSLPLPVAGPAYVVNQASPLWLFALVAIVTAVLTAAAVLGTVRPRRSAYPTTQRA